jgi:hypothetical protein
MRHSVEVMQRVLIRGRVVLALGALLGVLLGLLLPAPSFHGVQGSRLMRPGYSAQ